MEKISKYIIGIDAGGTKTTACAISMEGEVLHIVNGGFGNVTIDFDVGMANIKQAVDEIISIYGYGFQMICLGCAGIETGNKKAIAKLYLQQLYGEKIEVTNDAILALYVAHKGEDGILVIAGTGSIGFLKQQNEYKRFGGWGHLINDDGGGYSIVMEAIKYITHCFDTNNMDNQLVKSVFSHLNITENKQLIDYVYSSTKGEIASLVPIIVMNAYQGDEKAREILIWAGKKLADIAIGLATQYNIEKPNIAVSGSVLQKINLVYESFKEVLDEKLPNYTIVTDEFMPAVGAYYIYKSKL